ncbi:NAC domain containing protein 2 [Euphorbia peplus]|nr:NAC domain containing protein 2 [Euphorbia peplus]
MHSLISNLPVGWRFQPTNEELLHHYLKNKRLGIPIHGNDIEDIQICDFDPWDLIHKNSHSQERYLFYRRQFHKKTGGVQRKRKAKAGHWKRTGEIQYIKREDGDEVIGTKTIFVYQDPGPTVFVKHEFELSSSVQDDYDFVICKLMINKKKNAIRKSKKVGLLPGKEGATNSKEIGVDCSKKKPKKKARKGLSDCDPAPISVSNKQMQEETMADSAYGEAEPSSHVTPDFKYQSPGYSMAYSTCVQGKSISHLTFDSENQTPTMMTPTSTVVNGESTHQGACDSECPNEYEMNNTSVYDKDSTLFPMDSDLGNQNPHEMDNVSRYTMSVTSSQVAADLENQFPNDTTAISLHEINSFWSGNQNWGEITAVSTPRTVETISLTNFDSENGNQIEMISDLYCKEGERSYPVALDFGNQNPSKETNISASLEGRSLQQETSLDFGNQNQYEKNDMSNTINLDDLAETIFPQINSEALDALDEEKWWDDLLRSLSSDPTEPIN